MDIHFAVIVHEFGSTGFATRYYSELMRDLLDWVKEQGCDQRPGESAEETVERYFMDNASESLFIHSEALTISV